MTDTPPEIERMFRRQLMSRSNEERFVMGALMFDAARSMILASFPPDLSDAELRCKLSERLYGTDSEAHRVVMSGGFTLPS